MVKRMLIDAAHPEETRVVVLNGHRLEEFDFESSTKNQIKGNIYLAKVTRVEPSLQAAFVEYGGNRHGFLAFGEIHPDYYRIPVADRQAALAAERAAEAEADEYEERRAEAVASGHTEIAETAIEDDAAPGEPDRLAEESAADVLREPEPDEARAVPAPDQPFSEEAPQPETPSAEPTATGFATEYPAFTSSAPAVELAPPEGDAFAEDEAIHDVEAETAEEAEEEDAERDAATPGDVTQGDVTQGGVMQGVEEEIAPSDAAESGTDQPHPETVIETVGGDEIEETTRRRARPYRHYKIQEVIKRRQIMLVQVTKEERGNKGAALTTYISLAGRYCVLMPNTPRGGGVSRKITSLTDRRRLKDLVGDLEVPEDMGVIVRTAGSERSKTEIKRDFEYLLRLWDEIRDLTLKSTAPALIYEEGNLIKRAIRDLYSRDIDEVLVDGKEGYDTAKSFMRMLMPSHAKRVKFYNDPSVPLFHRFQVEGQLDAIHSPVVQLRSGGYLVINPTEALVAIDVNSGRSTRERNIEETAFKTNLEAAEEIARQLRLRDLAGLIVIDFIDMEERRNNGAVERRLKEAMRHDRARIQLGRISPFGLLELSRQRLRPSLLEASTEPCPHCGGTGHIRSTESTALHVLRAIEEEGMRRRSAEITVSVPSAVALYILNQKRTALQRVEERYGFHVSVAEDNTLVPPAFRLDRVRALTPAEIAALPVLKPLPMPAEEETGDEELAEEEAEIEAVLAPEAGTDETDIEGAGSWEGSAAEGAAGEPWAESGEGNDAQAPGESRSRRRRRRRRRPTERRREAGADTAEEPAAEGEIDEAFGLAQEEGQGVTPVGGAEAEETVAEEAAEPAERKRRRRGRRGGRRRRHGHGTEAEASPPAEHPAESEADAGHEAVSEPGFEPESEAEADEEVPEIAATPTEVASHEVAPHEVGPDEVGPHEVSPAEIAPPAEKPALSFEITSPSHAEEKTSAPEPAPAETEAAEAERLPAAYNVPPAREVSGPTPNPRRGWWRRGS